MNVNKRLIERDIPELKIDSAGGACPWQAFGTYKGDPFYARFRHNQGSMTVYSDESEDEATLRSVLYPFFKNGSDYDGYLDEDQVVPFMRAVIGALAPVSDENPTSQMILAQQVETLLAVMREGAADADVPDLP